MLRDFWRRLRGARVVACVVASLAALSAAPAGAQSADKPYGWTGFYGGVNFGVENLFGSGTSSCITPSGALSGFACNLPVNIQTNSVGIAGGLQAGYLHQIDRAVVGVEVDFSGLSAVSNSFLSSNGLANGTANIPNSQILKQQVDWLVTMRPRLGYAFDRTLVYATGGLAVGGTRMDTNLIFTCAGCTTTFSGGGQATMWGYTVGGGAEYAQTDRWSLRAEALYFNLGTQTTYAGARPPGNSFLETFSGTFEGVIARVAANYHF